MGTDTESMLNGNMVREEVVQAAGEALGRGPSLRT
jgi:hypothetical protein